jgi:hypothetical protein
MIKRTSLAMTLLAISLMPTISLLPQVKNTEMRYEVGIVYYDNGNAFKALDKEAAPQSGRKNYSARVKGAHALVRLRADQPQIFRVCGVDPSRFKLFRFKSESNARTVTIMKINVWIGGGKTVLSDSEIPVKIETAESGCFTLTPKETLGDGEFGFSPVEAMDAFMFGVGDIKESR